MKKRVAVVKSMWSAKFLQKNASKWEKNRLMELQELLDKISYYRWTWRVTEDAGKAKTTAPPTDNIASAKWIADSLLQSELPKKRKEERVSQGDFQGSKKEGEEATIRCLIRKTYALN